MNTKSFLLGVTLIAVSFSAQSAWLLDAITYHGYCPPAAIKAKLCLQGQDFVVESNTKTQDVGAYITPPKVVGSYVVNQMEESDGDLLIGSRVRVLWAAGSKIKKADYQLLDNWQDVDFADLETGDLSVINILGRAFTASVIADDETISIRGQFTETTSDSTPVNVVRDATMTFARECN